MIAPIFPTLKAQRRPAPSHARQLSLAVEKEKLTRLASPWCRPTDIGVPIIAAKPFTGGNRSGSSADMALFDHDVALAQKADIYSYLSWVALGFVPCGGSASPDWRIPDAYINTALSPGMD
jgi:hypothetical protein